MCQRHWVLLFFLPVMNIGFLMGCVEEGGDSSLPFEIEGLQCSHQGVQEKTRSFALNSSTEFGASARAGARPSPVSGIYLIASDLTKPDPNWEAKMQTAMTMMQKFYADWMEQHNHGDQTFKVNLDGQGKPKVFLVKGLAPQSWYSDPAVGWYRVWDEMVRQGFNLSNEAVAVMPPGAPSLGGGFVGGGLGLTGVWLSLMGVMGEDADRQRKIFCDGSLVQDAEYGQRTRGQLA
jgi:hypothetical protein